MIDIIYKLKLIKFWIIMIWFVLLKLLRLNHINNRWNLCFCLIDIKNYKFNKIIKILGVKFWF